METATDERCRSRHRLQFVVLVALLISGLLGMHALVGGPAAATASMASPGHASRASHGVTGAAVTPVPIASGARGMVHGSGGCADAMSGGGGSTCVSVPTGKSVPALPVPPFAAVPTPVSAPMPTPPSETPRRFALTHLELSIYRT
ncbi:MULTISPECIES: DUF6153 family protein [Dermacoccus]|uniref:Uncharacterized protein n=3 Tax=Dermacoccus TaxID=57495 RepID=A0A417Z978_9MICO|nr:DUF6153 family protein [Dermacoccus abyssi]RHW47198.1 hypothetical protein D1832_04250 [Dermacoccus abyssi]